MHYAGTVVKLEIKLIKSTTKIAAAMALTLLIFNLMGYDKNTATV